MKNSNRDIRILIINENKSDVTLIQAALAKSDLSFDIEIAGKQNEFIKKLIKFEPDVIIAKASEHKYSSLDIYDDARKAVPFSFFILETSKIGKEETNGLMLSGIDYFLQDGNYDILPFIVINGFNKKHLKESFHESKRILNESNQRLRSIFNNDQNAVLIIGFKNEIIDFNPAALKEFGINNSGAFNGQDFTKYVDKSDIKKFRMAHASAFRGRKSSDEFTLSLSKTIKKQASINFVPIKNEDGVPSSVILICKDITDAFLFRQKFRLSEERFMALADNAPIGIYYNNPDGRCVFVNKKWTEYTGLTVRESLGKGWMKSIHPDDKVRLKEYSLENNVRNSDLTIEYRVIHTSGEVKWLRGKTSHFIDETGKHHGYIGTIVDITQEKLSSLAIAEGYKKLEISMKLSGLGRVERDLTTDTSEWSDEVYKIFEVETRDNNPGMTDAIHHYLHPDDIERVTDNYRNLFTGDEPIEADFRIITPSGKTKYLQVISTIEKNIEGKPVKLISVIQDCTIQKQEMKTLKDTIKIKRTAMTLANIALWEIDLSVIPPIPKWDDNMFTMFERDISMGSPENREFLNNYVHPADKDFVRSMIKNYIPGTTTDDFYYRAITPAGKLKYLRALVTSENDLEGKPNKVLGFIQDITSLREGEAELRLSEEKFRYLFNHSPDAIYIEDLDGNILEANDQACMIQEMQKEELIGKNILDLAPSTIGEEIKKKFQSMAKGDITMLHSYSWNKSGKKIPVQIKQNKISYNMKPALLLHVRMLEI